MTIYRSKAMFVAKILLPLTLKSKTGMSNIRVYFPNLNSIRFIAALAVMIHHIELTKYWFGQPNIYRTSFVGGVFGQLGIILFFVLSGFLITYLLLLEQRETNRISIKNFYIRRILRIWPLYYLIITLSLFIIPNIHVMDVPGYSEEIHNNFFAKVFMFLMFVPNLVYAIYKHVPYAEQAWSVGVEEQFYLIWPALLSLVVRKNKTLNMLLGVIGVYTLIKITAIILHNNHPGDATIESFYQFWMNFCIDCMAIGGIAAYLLFYKKDKILNLLYDKYLQISLYITIAYITVRGIAVPYFNYEFYAIMFAVLILNLSSNKKTVLTLEYKPISYLGKISYGLYMYHNIMLVLALNLVLGFSPDILHSLSGNIIYYCIAICLTILASALSYEFFEKRFIKAKIRYSEIISGENAKEKETKPLVSAEMTTA
jgi:peptidoglycan/LPS O-acetylase OafA/YrhL